MSQAKRRSTRPFPVFSLFQLIRQRKIWLNPEYQRNAVWSLSQKQLLVDSLLNEIDIPKLYFREVTKGSYEFEVVDGQQRLRALEEYIGDQFSLTDDSDPVDGRETKGRFFSKLHTELQLKLQGQPLDVVILSSNYSDEDVEDMFLRLQNGTPLNAAEKRRALPGNMRSVVAKLADHKVFELCAFKNHRYAFEDVVAKVLHLTLYAGITDIRQGSIRKTYDANRLIADSHPAVRKMKGAFNFLGRAFKNSPNPKLKKYSIISLTFLVSELLERYNLNSYPQQFSESYLKFETRRITNEGLDEEKQDSRLAAYTDAARADSIPDLQYRHDFLKEIILIGLPLLMQKDRIRLFSDEQRLAIYVRDGGVCRICGAECGQAEYHADHLVPHAEGGETNLGNAQLLCVRCNLTKSSNI